MGLNWLMIMYSRIKRWFTSSQEKALSDYFKSLRKERATSSEVVLVECVEDLYYFGLFGQIASSLHEKDSIRIEQYILRSLRVGEANSIFDFLASRLFINTLHNIKWIGLYRSFCDGIGYSNTSILPVSDLKDLYHAWLCWRNLANKQALINLKIGNIDVGDLINDSYLRYKPAPTVNLNDFYLFILIWQTHRNVRRAKLYFGRVKPKLFLTSYSTYIQHGVPVRVALQLGVRVFSFGNYQEFAKELSLADWVHTKNPDSYSKKFSMLENQAEKLAIAESAIATRLSGGIDSATAYMKKSAYAESDEPVPDVRNAVIIFLHDFYDSPHGYREMVFPDFWEWICFTIDTLMATNSHFFIKPHPNQIDLNDNVLTELKKRYPNAEFISSKITNKKLVDAQVSCAVTVYGTVAHEMAYLGVPTIACARNPHISFDFCRTAKSQSEYAKYLQNPLANKIDKAAMKRQSLIFYYMHNLSDSEDIQSLKDAIMEFRLACEDIDKYSYLTNILDKIVTLPGYLKIISYLANNHSYQMKT